jgi:Domain of unknown function (DUF4942)/Methionine biosynthesis protein MetW
MTEIATPRRIPAIVAAEYEAKLAALPDAIAAFERAVVDLKIAASIQGCYGQETIADARGIDLGTLTKNLTRSGWFAVWKGLNVGDIASAKDKKLWEQSMAAPAPPTLDNLRATFAKYLENPRQTILRGLAEVFADLDPAYKSHEKVKVGVKGLPKRVILTYMGSFYASSGADKLRDIINALAAYQGKPLLTHEEHALIMKNGDALRDGGEYQDPHQSKWDTVKKMIAVPSRGVWLKRYSNGNGHLYFGPGALTDINRALAEFYGDVLADCPNADEARPSKRESTAVSKDLQFYPTPQAVIDKVLGNMAVRGLRVLEPSCGDGRFMVALKKAGAHVLGCEVDPSRANMARDAGLSVHTGNFLEMNPLGAFSCFDLVVMNPPFYGKHYAKHVRHALLFVKPGGTVTAILPATARYDHGLLDGLSPQWIDLPIGAFSESGTNICTVIATIRKK